MSLLARPLKIRALALSEAKVDIHQSRDWYMCKKLINDDVKRRMRP
jgi:hypothetical protein